MVRSNAAASPRVDPCTGVGEMVVRRMLNPKHEARPEKVQAALAAFGKRIVATFEDGA